MIVPDKCSKLESSQATKDAICKILKPSECALRVRGMRLARNNGVKIEADSPDLSKIRACPALASAGLKVVENAKVNPRLIVYGVPAGLCADDMRAELIAQNLAGMDVSDLKVIYTFPIREGRNRTNCIIEVTPEMRCALLERGRVYLRYSSCRFEDYVRVLQCFRCLAFGHIALNCKEKAVCGHCAGPHEWRDCPERNKPPKCANCCRYQGRPGTGVAHSAVDTKSCPILSKRIEDKIADINYG